MLIGEVHQLDLKAQVLGGHVFFGHGEGVFDIDRVRHPGAVAFRAESCKGNYDELSRILFGVTDRNGSRVKVEIGIWCAIPL